VTVFDVITRVGTLVVMRPSSEPSDVSSSAADHELGFGTMVLLGTEECYDAVMTSALKIAASPVFL
jgi:hypothetical protein